MSEYNYRVVGGEHVMALVTGRALDKALQSIAHNLCATLHPSEQIQMTGWLSLDGQFLVSCAHCKMKAYEAYKELIGEIA